MDYIEEFKKIRPTIEAYCLRLRNLLIDIAEHNELDFHVIEHRAKTIDSFTEKFKSPGKHYNNPLTDITDLCGLRVIFYYQEDVDIFCEAITKEFLVDKKNSVNKRDELNHDQFGYMSSHLVCQLDEDRANLFEWKKYSNIKFEVQVRTVLQHAWASISHAIQYKSKIETPKALARQLTRIAGLLELSDVQFSDLKNKSNDLKQEISLGSFDKESEINRLTVENYFSTSPLVKGLINSVKSTNLDHYHSKNTDQIIHFCQALNIKSIYEINQNLEKFMPNSTQYFSLFFDEQIQEIGLSENIESQISGDTDHWLSVALVSQQKMSSINKLKKSDIWSKDYFQSILNTNKKMI